MMAANPRAVPPTETLRFTLDGHEIDAHPGETILQAAARRGIKIPCLCYKPGYRPDGNCRVCMVEIEGEGVLAPSCWRHPTAGMQISSTSERSRHSQKLVLELLLADMPKQGVSPYRDDSELDHWARELKVDSPRFPGRKQPRLDSSHPAISVHLDACIQCTRCVRACREEQVNDVIGYAHRGESSLIVFDMEDPMGESSCVGCGECVQACPTGALMPAGQAASQAVDREVESVCPYCGVGCLLKYHVRDDRILYVNGRDGKTNQSRLCVKGRYGFDYVHHPQRLKRPLLRRPGIPKSATPIPAERMSEYFREADWKKPWRPPPKACGNCAISMEHVAWLVLAPQKAAMKKPTCFRSWCAPVLAPIMWITVRASVMLPRWPPCWNASAPGPSPTRSPTWPKPRSSW